MRLVSTLSDTAPEVGFLDSSGHGHRRGDAGGRHLWNVARPTSGRLCAEWAEHRAHRAGRHGGKRQIRVALRLLACGSSVTNSCHCHRARRLWDAANPHAPQNFGSYQESRSHA